MDDANTRATRPRPSPGTCAAAGIACGDPACQTARTVHSCQPCTGRESDSPGPTSPHARCRSYRTGKRRLSLGPARKNGPRAQAVRQKTPDLLPQSRFVAAAAAGSGATPQHYAAAAPEDRGSRHRSAPCAGGRRTFGPRRIPTRALRLGPTSPDHHPRHIGGSRATVVTSHRHAARLISVPEGERTERRIGRGTMARSQGQGVVPNCRFGVPRRWRVYGPVTVVVPEGTGVQAGRASLLESDVDPAYSARLVGGRAARALSWSCQLFVALCRAGWAGGGGEALREAAGVSEVREVAACWPGGDGRLRKHLAQPLLVLRF